MSPAGVRSGIDATVVDLSTVASLHAAYAAGATVREVVATVIERVAAGRDRNAWIAVASEAALLARADELELLRATGLEAGGLPLWGVPFAVKDNIDVAGFETTAACPAFGFEPAATAPVVQRLLDAGAVLVGKTNMDQFATGLVGVRSPHGVCRSVVAPSIVAGGSSSGSAVAVAAGEVVFSLGTDTAGSGRVPAQCNGIVGFKGSRGMLPSTGVVPACRSLDCVTVFASTVEVAALATSVAAGPDAGDPFRRVLAPAHPPVVPGTVRVAVPRSLPAPADDEDLAMLAAAVEGLRSSLASSGADVEVVEVDLEPFLAAGRLLYGGSWVAERYSSVGRFIDEHPDDVHPVVASIIGGGRDVRGWQVFDDQSRLADLVARTAEEVWSRADVLVLPTAADLPTVEEVLADPVGRNAALGTFTTFVNLLDLAAVSVPAGMRADGRPFGVSVVGPAGTDAVLAGVAALVR
jgi:allophanate hydrolase